MGKFQDTFETRLFTFDYLLFDTFDYLSALFQFA